MNKKVIDRGTSPYIGKLRANFMGTAFHVYDDGTNPKEMTMGMTGGARLDRVRRELAYVQYASNVLGARGLFDFFSGTAT